MEQWTDLYLEICSKFAKTHIPKESVPTFEDLNTTYPEPEDNWSVKVENNGFIYIYYNSKWNNTRLKDYQLEDIEWLDLWHDQVNYLTEELPFPTPAVFFAFNTNECEDLGQLAQKCDTQIDMYLFYETFSDTYVGSYNQGSALNYLKLLTKIHTAFHGASGDNFQTMRRVDMRREESGGAGNLYRISFSCNIEDASAQVESIKQVVNEVDVKQENYERPAVTDDEALFHVQT